MKLFHVFLLFVLVFVKYKLKILHMTSLQFPIIGKIRLKYYLHLYLS